MKKFFIFYLSLLFLQTSYFLLFMRQDFNNNNIYYNPISIISCGLLMVLYIINTKHALKYGALFIIKNFIVAFIMSTMLVILIGYLNFFFGLLVQMSYFYVYSNPYSSYKNPTIGYLFEYNLIFLNFVLFILNFIILIPKTKNKKYDKRFNKIHKIMTFTLIIPSMIIFFVFNMPLFFYYVFLIFTLFLYWLIIPFIKRYCLEFQFYHGVLIALMISLYFLWPTINWIIDATFNLRGFTIK